MRRRVYDPDAGGEEPPDHHVTWWRATANLSPTTAADPLTVLLWVLPLAAIVAGGWIIVARTRRQVRACAGKPLPAPQVCGARARWGTLRAGGRHCAGGRRRQLRPDRLSAGEGLAAGNGADAQAAGAGSRPTERSR